MWHAGNLEILTGGSGGEFWSTADAAWLLDTDQRLIREALRRAGTTAVGRRPDRGRGKRYVRVYRPEDVLEVLGLTAEKNFLEL